MYTNVYSVYSTIYHSKCYIISGNGDPAENLQFPLDSKEEGRRKTKRERGREGERHDIKMSLKCHQNN